jgi:hypothetical protein
VRICTQAAPVLLTTCHTLCWHLAAAPARSRRPAAAAVACWLCSLCWLQFTSLAEEGANNDVTPEEMEAYRLKKSRGVEDPTRAFKQGTDGYDML